MDKHLFKILFLIFFIIAISGLLFVFLNKKEPPRKTEPVPVAKAQEVTIASVTSPDGKFTLTMREEKNQDFTNYVFSSGKINFRKDVPSGTVLSIPLNTFSPDDKYIFLTENASNSTKYFAVTPSGNLDISAMFLAKYPDLVITDVTGWAAPTLLIVNTKDSSFWFDTVSKTFTQLSEKFN